MAEKPDVRVAKGKGMRTKWAKDSLEAVFADNLNLIQVNDQTYLTFGQVVPPSSPGEITEEPTTVEILPVARIVLTPEGFKKVVALLKKVTEDEKH
jgi:hypothetical protein